MIANPKIFKAYDIRGEWGKDWDKEFVYKIGRALAVHFKPKTVAIGRDMRNSSQPILKQLSAALIEEGVNVKDLGLCGTELTYFASSFVPGIDMAIMITASHNPGKDNGLKITIRESISVGLSNGLDKIRDLALSDLPEHKGEKGSLTSLDIWEEYRSEVVKKSKVDFSKLSLKKIVIDAGNGIGGYMFDKVLSQLNIEVVRMFWNPDGNFPNHPPDPMQEKNLEELKKKVVEEKADLGISLDGDSDRVFFIDEKGRYIPGYYFAALMADFVLRDSEKPQKEIILYDPRYYWAIQDAVKKHGAGFLKSKGGHTLIKETMRRYDSLFSVECSGHVFYRENNFAESSMLTILQVLKLISEKGSFSRLTEHFFNKYPMSGEINFVIKNSEEIMQRLEDKYSHGEICKLDGTSVEFADWRFNIRNSNTQPLLRLNVEAKSSELLHKKIKELRYIIGGEISEH